MPTESEFLDWLYAQHRPDKSVPVGPGDDLAVREWKSGDLLLVGIDQVLDGVHFDSKVHSPRAIGRKAMNRNLSDCAAMACLPTAAVVSVALPRGASLDFAKELYLGLREAADLFDCAIVGGDTSAWDAKLAMSVAILGRSDGLRPITRGGAKPGNGIFVTGALGGSILGRHLTFEPRIKLARELAAGGHITAMIDISDGLSRDLHQLCSASGIAAIIDAAAVPVHADARKLAVSDGLAPLEHALHDGEDHELLFTASSEFDDRRCVRIGQIVQGNSVEIVENGQRRTLVPRGWQAQW